jgi:hypothetical protein
MKNLLRGRRRGGRRKGELPPPLHLVPMGLKRLFETDDIEVAIRRLDKLSVWAQITRGATPFSVVPYQRGTEAQKMEWQLVQVGLDSAKKAGIRPPSVQPQGQCETANG